MGAMQGGSATAAATAHGPATAGGAAGCVGAGTRLGGLPGALCSLWCCCHIVIGSGHKMLCEGNHGAGLVSFTRACWAEFGGMHCMLQAWSRRFRARGLIECYTLECLPPQRDA